MESSNMTKHRYIPETHDPILIEMNQKWRRTDGEIADAMGFDKQTIYKHRLRLGLPINTRPRPVQLPSEKEALPPPERPNPVTVASRWLGSRLVEKPSGFWLDGLPVNTEEVVKAGNRILKANGLLQVGPSHWRVP
jgi:hypothetical protein